MRNESSNTYCQSLDRNFNHPIKNFDKVPAQSFNKEGIFSKFIDFGKNKRDDLLKLTSNERSKKFSTLQNYYSMKKNNSSSEMVAGDQKRRIEKTKQDYQSSFLYSEKIQASLDQKHSHNVESKPITLRAVLPSVNRTSVEMPVINDENICVKESNSEDSRVTGGGTVDKGKEKKVMKIKSQLQSKNEVSLDTVLHQRKKLRDSNPTRKVSFKVRNPSSNLHRKNGNGIITTTIKTNNVAAMAEKFDEMIRKNSNLLNDPKIAKMVDKIHSSRDKNSDSNNSTPTSTLPSGINLKIIINNKAVLKRRTSLKSKTPSNSSLDKAHVSESPKLHRKVLRVKSETTPKKRNSIYKNSHKKQETTQLEKPLDQSTKNSEINGDIHETKKVKHIKRKPSFQISPTRNSGSVSATIQLFESGKNKFVSDHKPNKSVKTICDDKTPLLPSSEQRPCIDIPTSIDQTVLTNFKPTVPEKKIDVIKTKNIVIRDGRPKIKVIKSNSIIKKYSECTNEAESNTNSEIGITPDNANTKICLDNDQKGDFSLKESPNDIILSQNSFLHGEITDSPKFIENMITESVTLPCQIENTDSEPTFEDISAASVTELDKTMSEEEKIYQEVSARIKPNNSFLWRTNSKSELSSKLMKEYDVNSSNSNNVYEFVGLCHTGVSEKLHNITTDEICPTFETIIKKADDLLDTKKKEIAEGMKKEKAIINNDFETEAVNINVQPTDNSLGLVEAINYPVVTNVNNIRLEIAQLNVDEGYEPLEPYRSDADDSNQSSVVNTSLDSIQSYHKTNCPLPEVPETVNENIYQSLYEVKSQPAGINSGLHNYEYYPDQGISTANTNADSDDGYEYCTSPKPADSISPINLIEKDIVGCLMTDIMKRYSLAKSDSITSSIGYEKISSIYERIPSKLSSKSHMDCISHDSNTYNGVNYDECNYGENIYDTIKHADTASVSNCYESIPGSPSTVIKRQKGHSRPLIFSNNHIPYDAMSNFSHSFSGSTISSDQKTNSIYGQQSNVSFAPSELTVYGQAPSELSSSDRSDDWVDVSDQDDSSGDPTIIIIRERTKAKRSPASWSRKVRHQWSKSPKKLPYSDDIDSSDAEHLYETLSHPVNQSVITHTPVPLDDFDSFDSDSESEQSFVQSHRSDVMDIEHIQLPEPPTTSNIYTLTKFASAAGKKMKQLKRNFTKSTRKKSIDGENEKRLSTTSIKDFNTPASPNGSKEDSMRADRNKNQFDDSYINTRLPLVDKIENNSQLKLELETKIQNKLSALDISPRSNTQLYGRSLSTTSNLNYHHNMDSSNLNPMKLKSQENSNENVNLQKIYDAAPVTRNKSEKDVSTISRKTYLSFKSKFRRSSSATEGQNSSAPLSIRKSVFYLNEYVDAPEITHSNKLQSSDNIDNHDPPIPPSRKHNRKSALPILETVPTADNEQVPDIVDVLNDKNTSPIINQLNSSRLSKMRPNGPPPPPPADHSPTDIKRMYPSKREKNGGKTTSWYAECGLFKPTEMYKPETNGNSTDRTSSSSWYAEIGLYQAGNISTSSGASSSLSGAGTCSTTAAPSPPTTPLPPAGIFNHEPLYQFYDAAKHESVCRALGNSSDSDGYEEIANFRDGFVTSKPIRRPSAMTLVNPQLGPSRRLWCEIPEVIDSSILCSLTPTQKRLQEAKFEIITSEASYLNSLTVLETHFIHHPSFLDEKIINKTDKHNLFGHILPVKKCSEHLLADLEACWQDNILLRGLCSIVKNHAEKYFNVYITYCEHQNLMMKTMQKLKLDANFESLLSQLQSEPACQSLSLHSFLMLPMQRATRLPLLMEAVLKKLDASDDEYQACLDAFATLNNVASQCNEGARKAERIEELINVSNQIEFPFNIKEIPIISSTSKNLTASDLQRWLVRSGELTHLVWRGDDQSKLTFGKKFSKITLQLFLFTDLLIITKKKGEDLYVVVDYCKRSLLEMTPSDMMAQTPVKESSGKHIILLTMLENCECKTVEMLLSCASETDRQRWIEACLPPPSDNPDETVYEGWDCPQVYTIYPYNSTQPDELNLQQGDVINVNKKMADGWYHGERIRDGEKGWFPGNYTTEIVSPHVRAKNLRQRYKLLALSGSYLGQQKKNKML